MLAVLEADIPSLQGNLNALAAPPRNRPPALIPTSTHPMQEITQLATMQSPEAVREMFQAELQEARHERADLRVLARELRRIQSLESPWTGSIGVYVGVLNYGDLDGVIASRGKLRRDLKEFPYDSDAYTVIKSHSFQEIAFFENTRESDATSWDEWHSSVLQKQGAPFVFIITGDGKDLPASQSNAPK